ncbi:uncharacterized protein N7458_006604 [Penicillium daleae]|uniref:Uncharacterized protein n=1 Tax=Penicillium daleae TaxID=63821 RepID=A0AAD6C6Y1_9EURO|nr:uncharacterized protein N7458_006604 [Penicillium daleae]KAJ5450155.1 hypothetical protein N7458_006604 [Penicillium daleae]
MKKGTETKWTLGGGSTGKTLVASFSAQQRVSTNSQYGGATIHERNMIHTEPCQKGRGFDRPRKEAVWREQSKKRTMNYEANVLLEVSHP